MSFQLTVRSKRPGGKDPDLLWLHQDGVDLRMPSTIGPSARWAAGRSVLGSGEAAIRYRSATTAPTIVTGWLIT